MEKSLDDSNKRASKKIVSDSSIGLNYRQRRRLEIKRRVGLLQYRRQKLEKELQSINSALNTLDSHMNKDI